VGHGYISCCLEASLLRFLGGRSEVRGLQSRRGLRVTLILCFAARLKAFFVMVVEPFLVAELWSLMTKANPL
jgi:hypothetical protein